MAITSSSFPWGSDASDKVTIEWDPAVKSQPIKVYTTANNTGSPRVMNIVVTPNHPGENAVIEIAQPGTDPIVSTTYGPLKIKGASLVCNGNIVDSASSFTFPAGVCNLDLTLDAFKDRTDTYASGAVVTTEVEAIGDTFYVGGILWENDPSEYYRMLSYSGSASDAVWTANGNNTTKSCLFSSLGTTITPSYSNLTFTIGISTTSLDLATENAISGSGIDIITGLQQEANSIVGISAISRVSWNEPRLTSAAASSQYGYAHYTGVYTFTSGSFDTSSRFIPVTFTSGTSWLVIDSQNPSYSATKSQVLVRSGSANTTGQDRTGYLDVYPYNFPEFGMIDRVNVIQAGGVTKTTVTIRGILQSSATGGLPTLRLTASPKAPASTLEVTVSVINKTSGSRVETYSIAAGSSVELYTLSDGDTRVSIVDVSPTEDSSCTYTF